MQFMFSGGRKPCWRSAPVWTNNRAGLPRSNQGTHGVPQGAPSNPQGLLNCDEFSKNRRIGNAMRQPSMTTAPALLQRSLSAYACAFSTGLSR